MRFLLLVLLLLFCYYCYYSFDVLMKNDDGFLIFLNKYLILNPTPITPTSPSEYDVSIHRDIIAARSYAMTMSM